MQGTLFLAVKSIGMSTRGGRKPVSLLQAARHTLREEQTERGSRAHIDPARTPLNQVILGPTTARGVVDLAKQQAVVAGFDLFKQRKDYCQAVELLMSLPPTSDIDPVAYFACCATWAEERFGAGSILSAVSHHDEASPHLHVLVSPIVDGKMNGSALVDRPATWKLKESFEEAVANRFGLTQPKRLAGASKAAAIRSVLKALDNSSDSALTSATWPAIRLAIDSDPVLFAQALGIELEPAGKKRLRSMTQIFTSPGSGPKTERHSAVKVR